LILSIKPFLLQNLTLQLLHLLVSLLQQNLKVLYLLIFPA